MVLDSKLQIPCLWIQSYVIPVLSEYRTTLGIH